MILFGRATSSLLGVQVISPDRMYNHGSKAPTGICVLREGQETSKMEETDDKLERKLIKHKETFKIAKL